jgi:flagellar capping protein FliD
LINQIQVQLRGIASYRTTDGDVNSLAELGIEFDTSGNATLNTTVFDALTETRFSAAFDFLGSATTGLGAFSSQLTQFSDPISGLIQLEQEGLSRVDQQIQKQIGEIGLRVELMRKGLALKLQLIDTLLATLESQQTVLTASLEALSLVVYGKKDG